MNKDLAQSLAKALAVACVRNTFLEDLYAGISPSSRGGDHSDVTVVTPYPEAHRRDVRLRDYHAAMKAKYERLARYPWLSAEPDPPEPE